MIAIHAKLSTEAKNTNIKYIFIHSSRMERKPTFLSDAHVMLKEQHHLCREKKNLI